MKTIHASFIISLFISATFYHQIFVHDHKNFAEQAVILSGNANYALAEKVAAQLQVPVGSAKVSKFNDGEINIRINESIRGKHVFIIHRS
ncbi:MAG: ribose-phosphate pyrophosphokinase-like domain-containing protein [Candidatus Chromulinivorax sp.]|nr:ribose-phosphate pyrophosphokinase-like domain-containing protein [Candidatus Chromulinivorax sp.]